MRQTAALALLLLLPAAGAYTEGQAPQLDARVLRAWHEPAAPSAGAQWASYLQLAPSASVAAVGYQVCLVPGPCIISPRAAQALGNNTWKADSLAYKNPLDGKPYPWPAGDVGLEWYLAPPGAALNYTAEQAFPHGLETGDPACGSEAACLRTHYVTFAIAPAAKGAPAAAAPSLFLLLALAAAAVRRHG